MEFDTNVRLAVYRHFASTGQAPSLVQVAAQIACSEDDVRVAFARLRARRLLLLESDGETIRMALPFSGCLRRTPSPQGGRGTSPTAPGTHSASLPPCTKRRWYTRAAATRALSSGCRSVRTGRSPAPGSFITKSRRRNGGRTWSSPEALCSSAGRKH